MKKTVYEVYDIYTEVKKTTPGFSANDARDAIANAFMDNEKPVATFSTADEAAAFIAAKGPGKVDDFGHYWRVHGWISYETDVTTDEDGETTDWESCGTTAISDFPPRDISINNGRSFCSTVEAIAALPWETIVNAMDDDTRETVAAEGYDTELEFLNAYLAAAPCDLIIG